jgi:hypothetical protein
MAQIPDYSGICEATLYAKQIEHTEFLDAIKKGRAEGLNKASNALFEKATQGNVTAMIYYLKVRNRENWDENQPEPLREVPPMQKASVWAETGWTKIKWQTNTSGFTWGEET